MVLEPVSRSNVSPPRPNNLLLQKSWVKEENNNREKMVIQDQDNKIKRKKKRRGAGAGVKRFSDLYVPTGENLGEGAQGYVATYRNTLTDIEYAVKVRN